MGEMHEQAFARKKTTMTPKHMKIYLVSFVNKNWYNGAIRKDHFTFTGLGLGYIFCGDTIQPTTVEYQHIDNRASKG